VTAITESSNDVLARHASWVIHIEYEQLTDSRHSREQAYRAADVDNAISDAEQAITQNLQGIGVSAAFGPELGAIRRVALPPKDGVIGRPACG
jgi:hypothetical protein